MTHRYSTILKAVAEGKAVQWLEANADPNIHGVWTDITAEEALLVVAGESYKPEDMRVKPDTVVINGHEVMAPVCEALPCGTQYYCTSRSKTSPRYAWRDSVMDYDFLDRGVVFLSKEDAAAYVNAVFNPEQIIS